MIVGFSSTIRTQWGHGTDASHQLIVNSLISGALTLAMLACAYVVILAAIARCLPKERSGARGFVAEPVPA
jgi:hypothetical protein